MRSNLRIHRRVPRWVEYDHAVSAIQRDADAAAPEQNKWRGFAVMNGMGFAVREDGGKGTVW